MTASDITNVGTLEDLYDHLGTMDMTPGGFSTGLHTAHWFRGGPVGVVAPQRPACEVDRHGRWQLSIRPIWMMLFARAPWR